MDQGMPVDMGASVVAAAAREPADVRVRVHMNARLRAPAPGLSRPVSSAALDILEVSFEVEPSGEAAARAAQMQEEVLLIILADHSGSMAGSWQRNAVPAIKYVHEQAKKAGNVRLVLIAFSDRARIVDTSSDEAFLSELEAIGADGGTVFGAGFKRALDFIQAERAPPSSSAHAASVVLALFTDGQDNEPRESAASFEQLKGALRELGPSVPSVCHCIGFTSDIDMATLDAIREGLGTQPGEFQYAGEGDPAGLQERLELLVHVAALGTAASLRARAELSLEGYTIVEDSLVAPRAGRAATREVRLGGRGGGPVTLLVRRDHDAADDAPLRVRARLAGEAGAQELACDAALEPATTPFDLDLLGLQACEARVEALGRSAAGLREGAALAPDWQEQIRSLALAVASAKQPAQLRPLGNRSQARATILELADSLAAQLTRLTESLSELAAGLASTGSSARMAEIAYGATFAKARRARMLATLSAAGAAAAGELEARLRAFAADAAALAGAPAASLELFRCVLTTCSWRELLLGAEAPGGAPAAEERDCLGWCVAVGRPEHAVDDPAMLRIHGVSNTLVSRGAFMDAVKYGIDVKGPEATHGGFGLESRGVAFTGVSREPINAWMPLYISAEHWRLALILWRPSIAYLCTLNPHAYADKQADAVLLLLGTTAARMAAPSERGAALFFAFLRTAIAAAQEPETGVGERARATLGRFLRDPKSVSNLLTVLGAVLALPEAEQAALVPDAAAEGRLWAAFVGEALRRSVHLCLSGVRAERDKKDDQTGYANRVGALVDALLAGDRAVAIAADVAAAAAGRFPASAEALPGALDSLHEARMAGLAAADAADAQEEAALAAGTRARLVDRAALRAAQRSTYERAAGASFDSFADVSYKRFYKKERRGVRRMGRSKGEFMAWEGEDAKSPLRAEWRAYLHASGSDASPMEVEEAPAAAWAAPRSPPRAAPPAAGPLAPVGELPGMEAARAHAWAWLAARFGERGFPTLGQALSAFAVIGAWRRIARAAGGAAAACAALDGCGGVAPAAWAACLREALAQREAAPADFRTLFGALGWELPVACLPAGQAAAPGPFASRWWTMYSHDAAGPAMAGAEAAEAARALIVHAAQTNERLAELEKEAGYRNPVREPAGYLAHAEALREREARAAYAARVARLRDEALLAAMEATRDLAAFAGMVRKLGPRRAHRRFGALLERFAAPWAAAMPLGAAKLRVLLSGVYEEGGRAAPVLDGGRAWAPRRPLAARLVALWGPAVYSPAPAPA